MLRSLTPWAALAMSVLAPSVLAQDARIDLRVLYAGTPDTERTEDFREFLSRHFVEVGTASFKNFEVSDADGFDVVLFDCDIRPTPGSIGVETPPTLPAGFDKASVLIGGAGALLAERQKLKIDWL